MVRGLLSSMGLTPSLIERMVEGDLKEAVVPGFKTVTTRRLMQTLGTDWGREAVHQDLWAKVAITKAKAALDEGKSVVIDDLRFPNEYALLRRAGGHPVRIKRAGTALVGSSRYEGLLDNMHFDAIIENDGTLEDLRDLARALIR